MKTGEKLTLTDIFTIKDLSVQIPIIQRDYAQGRNSKKSIRNEFLTVLFNALQDDKIVDLDFVYGYLENSKFIPLDGQQRLTTLFLLHYYLAVKDEQFDSFKKIFQQENLSKFTYKTRHSSRSFFDNLASNGEVILNEVVTISKLLKDQKWYFYEWENDPTVAGSLTMLDAIEEKFKNSSGYFQKLVTNKLISFEFLNLDEYNLSDDLYIKMNARGKSLTSFENFKARFENIIESVDSDLRKVLVNSIDTTWCDLFWELSKEYMPEKPAVDQLFLNYFSFITGLLFNKDEEISSNNEYDFNNFEIINLIYSSKENLKFLIDSLNLISASKDDVKEINLFFDNIFTNEADKNKVNIFEEETNLLNKLLFSFSSITHLDRFLLYSIIEFHLKFNYQKLSVNNEIIELSRLVRNFVVDINQKGNDNSRDDVVPNIRFSNVSQIFGELITLIEESKRLGNSEELQVTLPYSKEKFGVPSNLYIIGTMNTADRSVEALDTALRRRFSFVEMMPDVSVVEKEVFSDNFQRAKIMRRINYRIELLLDRNYTLGHSYFMKEDFKSSFKNEIIPLLQEYFYNDCSKIGLILGKGFVREKEISKFSQKNVFADFDTSNEIDIVKSYELIPFEEVAFEDALNLLLV